MFLVWSICPSKRCFKHLMFPCFILSCTITISFYLFSGIYMILFSMPINTSNLPPDIKIVLARTPYLWRQFNLTGETTLDRITLQRKWVEDIAQTEFIKQSKPKVIWTEEDDFYFFQTWNNMTCAYVPHFQEKCIIKKMSSSERLNRPQSYIGLMEKDPRSAAVFSIRNWEPRANFLIPENLIQIMHILEPPWIAKDTNLGLNNAILASYWRGSDIPIPYGMFIPSENRNDSSTAHSVPSGFTHKTELVAAIISNCESKGRLQYISALQKYGIPVHVYGLCGTYKCPKKTNFECLKYIAKKYKFFFSFENSRCEDYITEKIFQNALQHNIIPVVRGARPQDYKDSLPPNSYIDTNDFESPKDLGSFLVSLSSNYEEYKKYFSWKTMGGHLTKDQFQDFFCRACGMLFYADVIPPPKWENENIEWKDINKCLSDDVPRWT